MDSDLFVDGQWTAGSGRRPVIDPADGTTITEVALAGADECQGAVEAAARAQDPWSATPPRTRAEVLRRAFELMIDQADYLAELISRENGKALPDAHAEVVYAAEFFRWFSEEAVRIAGEFRVAPNGDKRIIVTQHPVGVSLLITPWNFPAAMATRKLAPALAAGCAVVLKPATETPLTALAIARILHDAGVPAGVVNVVVAAPTAERVHEMLLAKQVRNLSFTGSTEVGATLLREASARIVRTSMELGGNAPFLVMADADIDAAVDGAMIAKLRNGGAACTAANRFYVHNSVLDEFAGAFAKRMATLVMGPGAQRSTQLGALVSVSERDKVADLVENELTAGATALAGGHKPDGPGAFYPATLLTGVEPDADILATEIFGPVAPIVGFDDDQQAVAYANATEYGLISYVYSGDLNRALGVADGLEAGMVAINRGALSDPAAPFGGVKQSGLGREGGFAGIHEFLEPKYIAVDL